MDGVNKEIKISQGLHKQWRENGNNKEDPIKDIENLSQGLLFHIGWLHQVKSNIEYS